MDTTNNNNFALQHLFPEKKFEGILHELEQQYYNQTTKESWKHTPLKTFLEQRTLTHIQHELCTIDSGITKKEKTAQYPHSASLFAQLINASTTIQEVTLVSNSATTITFPKTKKDSLNLSWVHLTFKENSHGTITIEHGNPEGMALRIITIQAEKNSKTKIQEQQHSNGNLYRSLEVDLHSKAILEHSVVSTANKGVIKNEITVNLIQPHTHAELKGLAESHDNGHIHNQTTIHHYAEHTSADERYNYIAHDKSTTVFHGKIHVQQEAQHTESNLHNKNILLSEAAHAYTQPELELYADDIQCSHGATIGSLNKEQQQYLEMRGLSPEAAQQLLLKAIRNEILLTQ